MIRYEGTPELNKSCNIYSKNHPRSVACLRLFRGADSARIIKRVHEADKWAGAGFHLISMHMCIYSALASVVCARAPRPCASARVVAAVHTQEFMIGVTMAHRLSRVHSWLMLLSG